LNFETFSRKRGNPTKVICLVNSESALDTAFIQIYPLDTSKLLLLPLFTCFQARWLADSQTRKTSHAGMFLLSTIPTMLFISINTVSIVDVTWLNP
jgi:hypothetical protein